MELNIPYNLSRLCVELRRVLKLVLADAETVDGNTAAIDWWFRDEIKRLRTSDKKADKKALDSMLKKLAMWCKLTKRELPDYTVLTDDETTETKTETECVCQVGSA